MMPIQEQIISELMEHQAEYNYYLEWDGKVSGKPAFNIQGPYSMFANNHKWTLYMSLIISKEFPTLKAAEESLIKFFLKSDNKNGRLLKKMARGFREIAKI